MGRLAGHFNDIRAERKAHLDAKFQASGDPDFTHDQSEIIALEHEIDDGYQAIDDLIGIDQGLENLAIASEQIIKDDRGFSVQSAQMLSLAFESYTSQLGLINDIPASSEFIGKEQKLRVSKVSLESIKSAMKTAWNGIINFMKKIKSVVKKFYIKWFDQAKRVAKRAKKIADRADKTNGTPDEGTINVGSEIKAVHIGLKMPSGSELKGHLDILGEVADKVYGESATASANRAKEVKETFKGLNISDFSSDESKKKIKELHVKIANFISKGSKEEKTIIDGGNFKKPTDSNLSDFGFDFDSNLKNMERFVSPELLGGKVFARQSPNIFIDEKSKDRIAANLGKNALSQIASKTFVKYVSKYKKLDDLDTDAELDTLDISTIKDMCNKCEDIANTMHDYNKKFKDRDKLHQELIDLAQKTRDKFDKLKDASTEVGKVGRNVAAMIKLSAKALSEPTDTFSAQSLSSVNAVLTLCERSLSDYKE